MRKIIHISVICTMLLLASCEDFLPLVSSSKSNVTITVSSSSLSSATGGNPWDISYYIIKGSSSSGSFEERLDGTSVSYVAELEQGEWTFNAVAYNSNDEEIQTGNVTKTVSESNETIELTVSEETGTGTVVLEITADRVKELLQVEIRSRDGSRIINKKSSLSKVTGTSIYKMSLSLPAGFYQLVLYDGSSTAEATSIIRVRANEDSEYTTTYVANIIESVVKIENTISPTLLVTLHLSSASLSSTDLIEAEATVNSSGDFSYRWSIDEKIITTENSSSLSYPVPSGLEAGEHILKVFAISSDGRNADDRTTFTLTI